MKRLSIIIAIMFCCLTGWAQATSLVVDNQTPGWLSSKINYGDQLTVVNLTVTGYINGTDFNFIKELSQKRALNGVLDLRNVHIVAGGDPVTEDNQWEYHIFDKSVWFQKIILPSTITTYSTSCCAAPADTVEVTAPVELLNLEGYSSQSVKPFYIIPEGVKEIQQGDNKQVLLPTTLQEIKYAPDNVVYFSPLENPVDAEYYVYSSAGGWRYYPTGTIYVPKGATASYKNSDFKNMTIIEFGNLIPSLKVENDITQTYVGDPLKLEIDYNDFKNVVGWTNISSSGVESIYDKEKSIITFTSAGNAKIIATPGTVVPYFELYSTEYNIQVFDHTIGIECPEEIVANIGETLEIGAFTLPLNTSDGRLTYRSSNTSVVEIDSNGLMIAKALGNAIITIQSVNGNYSVNCNVTVKQPVESINLSQHSVTLKVNEMISLTAVISPTNANNKSLMWTSSDNDIVTVDANGELAAISGGTATITASSVENPDIKDECVVTVIQPVTGIALNKSTIELYEDESEQLVATISPGNASNKTVNWTSSDISIAMVSPDGTIYALKAGQATIMATTVDGGFVALCKVTVKQKTVLAESLTLSQNSAEITIDETLQLNATILPENTTAKIVSWSSTDANVAAVSETGLVTAKAEGSTKIIATTTDGSNLSAICEITVQKHFVPISSIFVNPSSITITKGESSQLNVIITPEDATTKGINWSSTDNNIVSVSGEGMITGVASGNAIIISTSTDGTNLTATCTVIVTDTPDGIDVVSIEPTMHVKIYTMTGLLVYEGVYSNAKLQSGIYLININGKTIKCQFK